jgi:hypothetical protein
MDVASAPVSRPRRPLPQLGSAPVPAPPRSPPRVAKRERAVLSDLAVLDDANVKVAKLEEDDAPASLGPGLGRSVDAHDGHGLEYDSGPVFVDVVGMRFYVRPKMLKEMLDDLEAFGLTRHGALTFSSGSCIVNGAVLPRTWCPCRASSCLFLLSACVCAGVAVVSASCLTELGSLSKEACDIAYEVIRSPTCKVEGRVLFKSGTGATLVCSLHFKLAASADPNQIERVKRAVSRLRELRPTPSAW